MMLNKNINNLPMTLNTFSLFRFKNWGTVDFGLRK